MPVLAVGVPSLLKSKLRFWLATKPLGAIALQRILQRAKCTASHWVKLEIPAFAVLYAGILLSGLYPFIDEILMILPPVFTISCANTYVTKNSLVIFKSNTNFKTLSSKAKKSFTPSKSGVIVSLSVEARSLFPGRCFYSFLFQRF